MLGSGGADVSVGGMGRKKPYESEQEQRKRTRDSRYIAHDR